ncbi:DUF7144 family membrane protein [Kitasatospora paranensis]|uniref:DUF7144 domain-containing protein n=1 Tax=Kitasatospora paranensis TaxID=258053 RepID=A0ABW2FYW1_9ACTN
MPNAVKSGGDRNALASGVVAVAAVMLLLAGVLNLFRGIMAITDDPVFAPAPDYAFRFSLTAWGWIHVVLAVIAVLVGLGLFRLARWARVAGIVITALLIIANFLSIPAYPLWSIIVIGAATIALWGLCTVRREPVG